MYINTYVCAVRVYTTKEHFRIYVYIVKYIPRENPTNSALFIVRSWKSALSHYKEWKLRYMVACLLRAASHVEKNIYASTIYICMYPVDSLYSGECISFQRFSCYVITSTPVAVRGDVVTW